MSGLRSRSRVQQLDSSAISSDLKRSDSQSSLLMPAKPVRGRKRSSSNVGQSRALVPLAKEYLLRALPQSSERIAAFQSRFRTPLLDTVFLWSGMLGAVGFFMCFLPAFFFFGFGPEGRELVLTLALGIYVTSVIKDIAQIPRPLAPPVTRLSLEYHALEYGFPSSHCGSTTTFATFYFMLVARTTGEVGLLGWVGGPVMVALWIVVCLGRIYCGMHTAIDCLFGSVCGLGLSLGFALIRFRWEAFLASPSLTRPLILGLLMTVVCTVRPDPPIPSVSFPDAIAFTSVVLGVSFGRWLEVAGGWDFLAAGVGSGHVASGDPIWRIVGQAWKYLAGVVCIILYRIVAKIVLERIYAIVLGTPRLYLLGESAPASTVASGQSSPRNAYSPQAPSSPLSELPLIDGNREARGEGSDEPVPINLFPPTTPKEVRSELVPLLDGGLATPPTRGNEAERLEWERKKAEGSARNLTAGEGESLKSGRQIFTKVIVYGGIGFIAAFALPLAFIKTGLGLR